ncbi:class C sortase [Herbiconiux sp. KACC 21604]|uniref:class C sortase n=1 Tax=unclassified Herbiconiux TaxID=2618217 RepID=UPI001C105DEB|nr:class C sortase [Herbiconiux sp. SALV-R1]WPO88422.1 class C sortase [Herbiconiux sp. KACC 21604]
MTAEVGRRDGVPPPPRAGEDVVTRRALRRSRRWRLPKVPLAIAVVTVIGAGLLLFPTIVSWFSQYEQSQRITELSDDVADLSVETLRQRLDEARAYNAQLTGDGANVAADERLPLAEQPEQGGDYAAILHADENGLMARLKIPSIAVDLPIYHGTSDDVLDHGVGHLEGTAVPVGGRTTHSILTAHRGLATSELFTHLDRVALDDTFTIEVFGEVLTYRVVDTRVVEPTQTETLVPVVGEDLITLVTCTPLGVNSHRILVTGERVIPTPQSDLDGAGERPEIPTFPWWALIAAGVLAVASLYVWWSGRPPAPRPTSGRPGTEGAADSVEGAA